MLTVWGGPAFATGAVGDAWTVTVTGAVFDRSPSETVNEKVSV
jgi:hypothetical protein